MTSNRCGTGLADGSVEHVWPADQGRWLRELITRLVLRKEDVAAVGFLIDDLPPVPPIFRLIQQYGAVDNTEMFEVYNMGVGFCVLVAASKAAAVMSILAQHRRKAWVIGEVIDDPTKGVYLPRHRLSGHKKHFHEE